MAPSVSPGFFLLSTMSLAALRSPLWRAVDVPVRTGRACLSTSAPRLLATPTEKTPAVKTFEIYRWVCCCLHPIYFDFVYVSALFLFMSCALKPWMLCPLYDSVCISAMNTNDCSFFSLFLRIRTPTSLQRSHGWRNTSWTSTRQARWFSMHLSK